MFKIKKYNEYFQSPSKSAMQELALKNADVNLLGKLYDTVDKYRPYKPLKNVIKPNSEEKFALLATAYCKVTNPEKYESVIEDAIEESRLRGLYGELVNCKNLVNVCFSISKLLNLDPIKSIKNNNFINTLIDVFKEYEIHFEDCELLHAHYSKGDVNGDSKIVFDVIKSKMPKLLKEEN